MVSTQSQYQEEQENIRSNGYYWVVALRGRRLAEGTVVACAPGKWQYKLISSIHYSIHGTGMDLRTLGGLQCRRTARNVATIPHQHHLAEVYRRPIAYATTVAKTKKRIVVGGRPDLEQMQPGEGVQAR